MTFVIAGGVEISGALSELKNFILPKDYPDLDLSRMSIHIIKATFRLVYGMSQASEDATMNYLKKDFPKSESNCLVKDYDGNPVYIDNGKKIESVNLIWAAGDP